MKANVYNSDCPSQSILALIGGKWSMLILCSLRAGPRRTHQIKRRLEGVSSKMLTQTLRELERHGIVHRQDHAEVPPRVEYALSPLGATMAPPLKALGSWSLTHGKRVEEARDRFDARTGRASRAA